MSEDCCTTGCDVREGAVVTKVSLRIHLVAILNYGDNSMLDIFNGQQLGIEPYESLL